MWPSRTLTSVKIPNFKFLGSQINFRYIFHHLDSPKPSKTHVLISAVKYTQKCPLEDVDESDSENPFVIDSSHSPSTSSKSIFPNSFNNRQARSWLLIIRIEVVYTNPLYFYPSSNTVLWSKWAVQHESWGLFQLHQRRGPFNTCPDSGWHLTAYNSQLQHDFTLQLVSPLRCRGWQTYTQLLPCLAELVEWWLHDPWLWCLIGSNRYNTPTTQIPYYIHLLLNHTNTSFKSYHFHSLILMAQTAFTLYQWSISPLQYNTLV